MVAVFCVQSYKICFFFKDKGVWTKNIPGVDELRTLVVGYMVQNKERYIGNPNDQQGAHLLTQERFTKLIQEQSKADTDTDDDGFFVEACCNYLNIQLDVVLSDTHSFVRDPLLTINRGSENDEKIVFTVGYIRNSQSGNGHYQFIFPHPAGVLTSFQNPDEWFQRSDRSAGKLLFS